MARKAKQDDIGSAQFDENLERLKSIVEKMEQGELNLDESLKMFEEGIKLSCNLFETLSQSEGKVEELLATMEKMSFGKPEE
jgi:exodeoxyribonuclease VII small subunit